MVEGSVIINPFEGALVAIVTPMNKNGSVDYPALEDHVEFLIQEGINGIVPCGTTGESAGLTHPVHGKVIERVIEYSGGRVPILAGTGGNSKHEAIKRTKHARDAGADGALIVEPYYIRAQEVNNVNKYFVPIALAVPGFPLIAYHVPSRTGARFSMFTPRELAKIPEYVGIKFASELVTRKIAEEKGASYSGEQIIEECGDKLALYSGEDALNLEYHMIGGRGCISVTANVNPSDVAKVYRLFKKGDIEAAQELQQELGMLNNAMFVANNPDSVKTALYMMGMIQPYAKDPIGLAEGESRDRIREALHDTGIHTVEGR
ncbi:MAG: 4-hydroxy-tetrahydrodipicolinate synthase [Nanoarchaeota archaeon]|nr:4-hydroxy-tetrahydrodipicolinate synthase [Nanoarchaeota archaeon]